MTDKGVEMASQRARLLVIEDDERLSKGIHRALKPEHEVFTVASAEEALARITAGEPFDLILCDLMLPRMSGMVFHQRMGGVAPELVGRIVFTTGGAYTPEAAAFLERVDIRHIEKPFVSLAALRAAVEEHLRRLGHASADAATVERAASRARTSRTQP